MTLFDPDEVVYLTPDSPNGKEERKKIVILITPGIIPGIIPGPGVQSPIKLTQNKREFCC